MILSKNFTLKELTRSNTALRLGIDNTPSKEGIWKLTLLAAELLQPLRNVVGSLRITSGYRSPQLSEAIGSSSNSQHCRYEAVDMQYVKRGKMDNIKIYEPDWIHLSWKVVDNRRQTLVAYKDENNKTKYRPIINYNCI
jgi:zinc D-Ala-D-Ala carboxypeptidase